MRRTKNKNFIKHICRSTIYDAEKFPDVGESSRQFINPGWKGMKASDDEYFMTAERRAAMWNNVHEHLLHHALLKKHHNSPAQQHRNDIEWRFIVSNFM